MADPASSSASTKPSQVATDQTSGRGLSLLRRLADRYGNGDGCRTGHVWFEIDLPELSDEP
jgi:hypothetical protein